MKALDSIWEISDKTLSLARMLPLVFALLSSGTGKSFDVITALTSGCASAFESVD